MGNRDRWLTAVWAACVCVGLALMLRYDVTPGAAATPLTHYQSESDRLLVFVHPQCPCSRATIGEIDRIASKAPRPLDTTFYFYRPQSESDSWCQNDLWCAALRVPHSTSRIDVDGKAARGFGARTSGQVLLYAGKTGKLVFSGGVTAGRGHEGDNGGEDAINAYLTSSVCPLHSTSVYGCAIW